MMRDETDDRAVLMLSQSKWMDETALDERSQFLYLDAVDGFPPGGSVQRRSDVGHGSADEVLHHDPGFNSLADQRVANKLEQLLSDIERRVEAKEELDRIQNRVEMSIMEYRGPATPGPARRNQNLQRTDIVNAEKSMNQHQRNHDCSFLRASSIFRCNSRFARRSVATSMSVVSPESTAAR